MVADRFNALFWVTGKFIRPLLLRVQRKGVSDSYWLKTRPVPSEKRYRDWTVPAALPDSCPYRAPSIVAHLKHNAALTPAWSLSDDELVVAGDSRVILTTQGVSSGGGWSVRWRIASPAYASPPPSLALLLRRRKWRLPLPLRPSVPYYHGLDQSRAREVLPRKIFIWPIVVLGLYVSLNVCKYTHDLKKNLL